jgi:hypothetical protein
VTVAELAERPKRLALRRIESMRTRRSLNMAEDVFPTKGRTEQMVPNDGKS